MIGSLQSLRFLFALMIFHHHFFINPQVVQFGSFPVAFFFILSGYVMAMGYEEKVCSSSFSYRAFVKKRLVRIFPLHLFCLFFALILPVLNDVAAHHFSLKYVLATPEVLLVQTWLPLKGLCSLNPVSWYLSSLLLIYLLFPFLMRWLRGRYGMHILALLLISYFLMVPNISGDIAKYLIYTSPYFRVVDFMLGIMLYLLLNNKISEAHKPFMATVLEIIAVALSVFTLVIYSNVSEVYGMASLYWIPSLMLIGTFVVSMRWGGVLSSILSQAKLVYFGKLSFPIYMMHYTFRVWWRLFADKMGYDKESLIGALICFTTTILMAYLYTEKIEPQINKRIKHIL